MQVEQDLSAQENLAKLSQNTHYLSDWNEKHQKKRKKIPYYKIYQQHHEHQSKPSKDKRQYVEQYDLRKWENKMALFNKIQYPLLNDIPNVEQTFILPKFQTPSPQIENSWVQTKRKDDFNKKISQIIEQGLVKRKLDLFRNKIELLERNIHKKEEKYKPSSLPRSFMIKRNSKTSRTNLHQPPCQQPPKKEVNQFKHELEIQKRKYSMPNLAKINTYRYLEYASQQQ